MTDQDAQALRLPESTRVERSEEHTSELQSPCNLVCRLLLEKKCGSRAKGWADHTGAGTVVLARGRRAWRVSKPGAGMAARFVFFFNDTATTEIYTLSLHDALPIYLTEIFDSLYSAATKFEPNETGNQGRSPPTSRNPRHPNQ